MIAAQLARPALSSAVAAGRPMTLAGPSGAAARRAFSTSIVRAKDVENVTVFGGGLMGSGIAQVLAHKGKYNVTLADVTDDALVKGKSIITKSLARVAKKQMADADAGAQEQFVKSIVDKIRTTTDAAEAVKSSDLVIEAIIENVKIKQELFKFLDGKAPETCIFATNTSSLSVKDCAGSSKRADRFGGFHAFNPVPQMKLIEIVRTNETSDATFNALIDVAKRMGKVPVACVDSPGFIVNRLLVPYMLEAIRLVERGEATMQDVDTAMKLGAGYPMGPFELSDLVGLDTLVHISKGWRESRVQTGEISADVVAPSKLLEDLVSQGRTGKKSGKGGFYPA